MRYPLIPDTDTLIFPKLLQSTYLSLNHQEVVVDVSEATVKNDRDDDEDIVDDGEDDDGEDDDALQDEQGDLQVARSLLAH